MSRHKLVKSMNLDDELDDFDGADDYTEDNGDTGLSAEDEENMRVGTISVREALQDDAPRISDKQIQDSLWHYYYDVDKVVTYLRRTYITNTSKDTKKKASTSGGSDISPFLHACYASTLDMLGEATDLEASDAQPTSIPFSCAEFFQDVSWVHVPMDQQAILTPPNHPWGLLGGSSNGPPKMSKLQALAAARRKKAQEATTEGSPLLQDGVKLPELGNLSLVASNGTRESTRSVPVSQGATISTDGSSTDTSMTNPISTEPHNQSMPSTFANTLISSAHAQSPEESNSGFSMPYTAETSRLKTNPFSGPSPDDIVLAAQSKVSGKAGKDPPTAKGSGKVDQVANGVEKIKLEDAPRAVSKNLDVLAEYSKATIKSAVNFVVIGHVDAGKSTLMGRLLYDLQVVDQRTLERYRKDAEKIGKSSFALAWVLDQGTEERNRGVTIDIAMNKFETDKTKFTILDAPGHRDFIPNMIAGTSQADLAVLVIDASTGSFESGLKGQTREHALLARSMGIPRIIIAVNKLETVQWSKDRFDEISQQISAFLITAGFQSRNLAFIPCSGLHGANIVNRTTDDAASWYDGPTLINELGNSEPASRALEKPLRMMIGDVFRGGVQNPLSVSGRIEAGSLQVADALLVQPSGQKCYIRSLDVDSESKEWAVAGQNVTLHLGDIEAAHLRVGDVLCAPTSPITNITTFTCKVLAFEFLTPMQLDVHRGRLHIAGKLVDIVAVLDKQTGAPTGKKKPRLVKPGQVARLRIDVETAVPLEAPVRVVLRSEGQTVAAGLLE